MPMAAREAGLHRRLVGVAAQRQRQVALQWLSA